MNPEGSITTGDTSLKNMASAWVDQHADVMFRYAMRRVGDRHVAEELLQEAFLAALKAKDNFRGESSVRTWLIGILRLKIIDYFRQRARQRQRDKDASPEADPSQQREHRLRSWSCNPERTFENKEFWSTLDDCLRKLPKTLAAAYMLKELDQCSSHEICDLLNISSTNLSVRIYRARALLRDCLDANWFHHE